jgi:hypothetical protein
LEINRHELKTQDNMQNVTNMICTIISCGYRKLRIEAAQNTNVG